jgi:Flp pilus assembly protein TadG
MRRSHALRFRICRFANCERGTQLVELAIVLPVLLVLFGATAEFGRFFYTYTTLSKATRSAARYLTIEAAGGAADAKAENLVVYGNADGTGDPIVTGLTTDHVRITREGGVTVMPERVKVQIEGYTYQPLFDVGRLLGKSGYSLNIDVSPSTTMRFMLTTPS